jgi:hypothetical protein
MIASGMKAEMNVARECSINTEAGDPLYESSLDPVNWQMEVTDVERDAENYIQSRKM